MQQDPEPAVRVLAVETVEQFRPVVGFIPAFVTVLANDAVAQVRFVTLHALNLVRSVPEALELIRTAATNDPANGVRQFAQAIVDSISAGATQQGHASRNGSTSQPTDPRFDAGPTPRRSFLLAEEREA